VSKAARGHVWDVHSNDAYDSETEVDKAKRESVVNLTQNRDGVLAVARVCLVLGGALLAYAVRTAGDARAGWMLATAVAIGHVREHSVPPGSGVFVDAHVRHEPAHAAMRVRVQMYQAPPFRLSYKVRVAHGSLSLLARLGAVMACAGV
jgi:hypothetical protein